MLRSLLRILRRPRPASDRRLPTATAPAALDEARPFGRRDTLASGGGATHDLTRAFCSRPWDHFEIGTKGRTMVCCPSWLPTPIGNLGRADLPEVWNSRTAQKIRRSILDGSFRYCVQQECPLIQAGQLPDRDAVTDPRLRRIIDRQLIVADELPRTFNLCYDESCNLRCPSCRRDRILFTTGPEYDQRLRIQEKLVASLFDAPHQRSFRVNITGSGDPFASKLYLDLLSSIDGADYPNVVFDLQTNGVLFHRRNWQRIARIQPNIGEVMVSFDAATAETYAYTRMGGDWAQLLDNLAFLGELRRTGSIRKLRLDFVVQQRNYREMRAFVELAKKLDGAVDRVSFNLITDWGTYASGEFAGHAIWKAEHPEFDEFLRVLADPVLGESLVHLGNLSALRARALERTE